MLYEAGQHLIRYDPPHNVKDPAVLNLFMSAQKDPRMRQAYQQYLRTWAESGGGLMLHFYGIGEPEPRNFFGMLDHLHQPSTPKYAALMEYLGTNYTYVPPAKPAYIPPPDPAIAQRQAQQRLAQQRQQQAAQQQQRAQQIQRQQAQQRTQHQQTPTTAWDSFLEPNNKQQAASTPQRQQAAPSGRTGLQGPALRDWAQQTGNSAISPSITIKRGERNRLSILWRYQGNPRRGNEVFRIYALDNRGGRKILLEQTAADIAEIGNFDQLFEEDMNRYIGPPIRLMIEATPGLNTHIERINF